MCRTCGVVLKGVVTGNAEIHLRSKHGELFPEFQVQKQKWMDLRKSSQFLTFESFINTLKPVESSGLQ